MGRGTRRSLGADPGAARSWQSFRRPVGRSAHQRTASDRALWHAGAASAGDGGRPGRRALRIMGNGPARRWATHDAAWRPPSARRGQNVLLGGWLCHPSAGDRTRSVGQLPDACGDAQCRRASAPAPGALARNARRSDGRRRFQRMQHCSRLRPGNARRLSERSRISRPAPGAVRLSHRADCAAWSTLRPRPCALRGASMIPIRRRGSVAP